MERNIAVVCQICRNKRRVISDYRGVSLLSFIEKKFSQYFGNYTEWLVYENKTVSGLPAGFVEKKRKCIKLV
jgi:hypothetical protein